MPKNSHFSRTDLLFNFNSNKLIVIHNYLVSSVSNSSGNMKTVRTTVMSESYDYRLTEVMQSAMMPRHNIGNSSTCKESILQVTKQS